MCGVAVKECMYAARLGKSENCLANHTDVQGEPQDMFPDEDEEEDSGTWLSDPPPGKRTLLVMVSHTTLFVNIIQAFVV